MVHGIPRFLRSTDIIFLPQSEWISGILGNDTDSQLCVWVPDRDFVLNTLAVYFDIVFLCEVILNAEISIEAQLHSGASYCQFRLFQRAFTRMQVLTIVVFYAYYTKEPVDFNKGE
jgi:hypothetical protein